tara:strand:- start:705 stop:1739 length:1035 start_codon:yes stop_codon:yes gene_type:complete
MLAITLVLLCVFISGRLIRYLEKAASGDISFDLLFLVLAYRLPEFLQLILPLGFFLGILLAYGRMYLENEMTVLKACGFSDYKLMGMSLFLASIVGLIVGGCSIFVTPWGLAQAKELLEQESRKTAFELITAGRFQELRNGERVAYVESISTDKKILYGVFIAELGNNSQIYAESGTLQIDQDTQERILLLKNGTRYQGIAGETNYLAVSFKSLGLRIDSQDIEKVKSYEEISIPTIDLLTATSPKLIAELHWRLSLPLLLPIICLFAVPFSRVNPRQGRFSQIFPAMLIYVLYLGSLIYSKSKVSDGSVSPYLGLWLVHIFFLLLSISLIARNNNFFVRITKK